MAADYCCISKNGIEYSWQKDDKVAVTLGTVTYGYTEQLCFWASSTQGATRNHRSLYATGYALKDGNTYYAYCPYLFAQNFSATAVQFSYDGQTQDGNASTAALYSHDYRIASATVANSECTFSMKRIGSLLRIVAPAPAAASFASISVTAVDSDGEPIANIPATASTNLLTSTVTWSDMRSSITLSLSNITLQKDEPLTAYLMLPASILAPSGITTDTDTPCLSAANVRIDLTDTDGNVTELATIKGFNTTAGYLYNIDLTAASSESKALSGVSGSLPMGEGGGRGCSTPIAYSADIPLDPTFTLEVVPRLLLGDVNSDGIVNITDARLIIQHYLGILPLGTPFNPTAADVNQDGIITVADANALVNLSVK